MTRSAHEIHNAALLASATHHATNFGAEVLGKTESASIILLHWLSFLKTSYYSSPSNILLSGVHAAIIEASGCLALGLVRPAIFSIRGQVDMMLAWIFFFEHPAEWRFVEETGDGYLMRKDVWDFLKKYYPRFKGRFDLLSQNKNRQNEDPYSLLSAHVHGQNTSTIPQLGKLESIVCDIKKCSECIDIQTEVSEYLSDVLLARFATQWIDLPEYIRQYYSSRLKPWQLKSLCSN